jgi:MbtH protein
MNSSQETRAGQPPMHRVVVNHEGQYSLWFADREIPAGWSDAGKGGTREECLAYVEEVWTDMRPLSLRRAMGEPV